MSMRIFILAFGFFLLAGLVSVQAEEVTAAVAVCTQDAKACPDGSFVSRQGPNCEFAACPAGVSGPIVLARCAEDADCIVVPYQNCCGATKRAINKTRQRMYQAHPEWQKFDGPECATIGVCASDGGVTQAHCARKADEKMGVCTLTYTQEETTDESPAQE